MSSSESALWREKGKKWHSTARLEDGSRRADLLEGAIRCYAKAANAASSAEEKASAHKNCATALTELHQTRYREGDRDGIAEQIRILREWSGALYFGLRSRLPESWLDSVQHRYTSCFQAGLRFCEEFDFVVRASLLARILRAVLDDCFKFECLMELCRSYLAEVVHWLEKDDYGRVLACTQECAIYLEEADAVAATASEKEIVNKFKSCNDLTRIQASAMQTIRKADSVLQDMIRANQINEDVLYEAIDWYTRAAQMTEDNGLDSRKAYEKLAFVYRDVVHNLARAASYDEKANISSGRDRFDLIGVLKDLPQPSWHEENLPVSRYRSRLSREADGKQCVNHSDNSDQRTAKGQDNLQEEQTENQTKPALNASSKENEETMGSAKQDTGSDTQDKESNNLHYNDMRDTEGDGQAKESNAQGSQSNEYNNEGLKRDKQSQQRDKERDQQDKGIHQKHEKEDKQCKERDQQDKGMHQKDEKEDKQCKERNQQDKDVHQKDNEVNTPHKERHQEHKESRQHEHEGHSSYKGQHQTTEGHQKDIHPANKEGGNHYKEGNKHDTEGHQHNKEQHKPNKEIDEQDIEGSKQSTELRSHESNKQDTKNVNKTEKGTESLVLGSNSSCQQTSNRQQASQGSLDQFHKEMLGKEELPRKMYKPGDIHEELGQRASRKITTRKSFHLSTFCCTRGIKD